VERRRTIPIRVTARETTAEAERAGDPAPVRDAIPPVVECPEHSPAGGEQPDEGGVAAPSEAAPQEEALTAPADELEMWRDRALRLEAEMDNFRKRQRRLADDAIAAERARLLQAFLTVADNLGLALAAEAADPASLRRGVEVTYQNLLQLLDAEGVKAIEAVGRQFDPAWHEAVGTVAHQQVGAEPDTVIEVVRPGYLLRDTLLRPARVIVAVS